MRVNDEELGSICEDMILINPDRRSARMFLGSDYLKCLHHCFDCSDIKYAFSNDVMYGEAGAQRVGPFHYNVWIAYNDAMVGNKLFFYEQSIEAMKYFDDNFDTPSFSIAVCYVNCEYKEAVRYAKHIGFEIDEFSGSLFKMTRTFWR